MMEIFVAQDYKGNVYVADDRDDLPPDTTDVVRCYLPERDRHTDDPVLNLCFHQWGYYEEVDIGG
jgi:hypothetical protein